MIAGSELHSSIGRSVRAIGLGRDAITTVETDDGGAVRADAARDAIVGADGPVIVCAQAGNVNAGGFDPLDALADAVDERRARRDDVWLHVDGAFGLWVRASGRRRHLAAGAERADSWACDAHKWLNTPYDCGISIVANAQTLARAVGVRAAYLPEEGEVADASDRVLEFSRRARVCRSGRRCGRSGGTESNNWSTVPVMRRSDCCGGRCLDGVQVHGQAINQVVVEIADADGRPDSERTSAVLGAVVADGRCYPSATVWQGRPGIRLSVSNWRTDLDDARVVADAFQDALRMCE